jgi:hypothetical protein
MAAMVCEASSPSLPESRGATVESVVLEVTVTGTWTNVSTVKAFDNCINSA